MTILLLLTGWLTTSAQNQRFEKIKAHKVAYLTEKMELSVSEAEKFWPLYNEYEKAQQEIRSQKRSQVKNPSDDQAKEILFNALESNAKEIDLKREFYKEAAQILSYKKLYLMEQGEREFRLTILERYKNMRKR
ncbi:hypothetical protein KUV50_00325 [Membranicola marinus]|uniref:Sensor of ECF-type sigma factor n=1 Tax=Membranihabitans marinus TaxID=1227546 RepID=A0A953HIP1_9BACT|nr:hypothetical protein [Membranihabitans marinus]MBY5956559.1 hypothetical protein [Membranihabitans marinus]